MWPWKLSFKRITWHTRQHLGPQPHRPHFKLSVAACGLWPLNWTEQTDAFPSLQEVLLGSAGQGRGSGRRQLRKAQWAGAGGTFTLRAGPRPHRLRWLHPRWLWAEQLDHHPGPQLPTGHCEQVT